jgi:CRISPR system Cascade subunit CasD
MQALLLRLDAPLMSFGGVVVDQNGVIDTFPGTSLLVGLAANAFGLQRRQFDELSQLQARLRFAVRCDHAGQRLVDFQTVDMNQPMFEAGWTTAGVRQESGSGTHIRYRHYWADALFTVALTLIGEGSPSLEELEAALQRPARPLFLGRSNCLPSAPLVLTRIEAPTLREAVAAAPRPDPRRERADPFWLARWPQEEGPGTHGGRLVPLFDQRDFRNQIHAGRRLVWEGRIPKPEELHA